MNAIEFKNVSFSYGAMPVLKDISFTIREGDYVGIIGPNGGGKTTAIKLALGLLEPQAGEIMVFGERLKEFKDKYRIGYVPQRASQTSGYFPATVREVVASGRAALSQQIKSGRKADRHAVSSALEAVAISRLENRLASDLSGGEKQRVFIARALAAEPKMLILDEPTAEIDPASENRFYELLKKLNNAMGITIMLVSHDIGIVSKETKSVICLSHGLLCHTVSQKIVSGDVLEKLYGDNIKKHFHEH